MKKVKAKENVDKRIHNVQIMFSLCIAHACINPHSVCLSVCLSLCVCVTHTHTHTHRCVDVGNVVPGESAHELEMINQIVNACMSGQESSRGYCTIRSW